MTEAATEMTGSVGDRLADVLRGYGEMTIAVSGGVDSMTLASFAHRIKDRGQVRMAHATSPAVPSGAQERIKHIADTEGWNLAIVDARELADPRYLSNPVNRCFFCKTNLYATLARLSGDTIASGANCDDLGDYRPGLEAARNHGVVHPFIEAGLSKADVRQLARELGHEELAELPASPCLSSRIETGIAITPADLARIDKVEAWLRRHVRPATVRCRIRKTGIVIELDAGALAAVDKAGRQRLLQRLIGDLPELSGGGPITIQPYRRGSAFVGDRTTPNQETPFKS
jgi:uncharacterized protein